MSGYNNPYDLYNRYHQEANAYATHYGLDRKTDKGGAWDAFHHAWASGAMTREYGETAAHAFGNLNEIRGDLVRNQQEYDKNMDKWNNFVGRDIGRNATNSDEIAHRVYEAMRRGDLIVNPKNDTRRYDGDNPPGERNNSGINGGTGGSGDTGGEDAITEETAPSGQDSLVPDLETDLHTDQLSNFPAQNLIPVDNTSSAVIQETPEPKVRQRSDYDYQEMQEMQQSDTHNPASTPVHVNESESDSSSLVAGEKQQTAVDPLVIDMRGDGLLSYSGQLRHGGWVDTGNGSLVWCYNNGGIIDDNSQSTTRGTVQNEPCGDNRLL